jgi:glycosyltransferase involved in cell wall biosynthesis
MKVTAVVPAYNEAAVVADVVRGLRAVVTSVVLVDDGSTDDTARRARQAGATVARHLINRGQGAALETGTRLALGAGADVVVHFDADGQHDPADVPRLVAPVAGGVADVALGSRFLGQAANLPLARLVTLKLGILFTWLFSGLRLTDTHNGLRALSRASAERIHLRHDTMAHASEVLDYIADLNLRYVEVPVTVRYTPYSLRRGQRSRNALRIVRKLVVGKFFGA